MNRKERPTKIMESFRLIYISHPNTTRETEISVLANVYKFLLDSKRGRHLDSSGPRVPDASGTIMRRTEEVSDVERRPR